VFKANGGTISTTDADSLIKNANQTAGIVAGVALRPLRKLNHFSIGADFNFPFAVSRAYNINTSIEKDNYSQAVETAVQFKPAFFYIFLQYNFDKKKV
jgi:hypothetical protein